MKIAKIYISPEEKKVLDYIHDRLPIQNGYKDLLSLVSNMDAQLSSEAKLIVESWLKGLYVQELADKSGNYLPTMMEELSKTADTFSSDVQNFLNQSDMEKYAQALKRGVYGMTTRNGFEIVRELKSKIEEEVNSNSFELYNGKVLEVYNVVSTLENLAKKAGLETDFQEAYTKIARYGILRVAAALERDPEEFRHQKGLLRESVYQSIEFAKSAVREIDDEETYSQLAENLSSLEKRLESLLKIDVDNVKELTGEKPKENKFIAKYKAEINRLSKQNEAAMRKIYAEEGSRMFTERYNLIVGLFKEALLNEAIGNIEQANELVDDINHEFQDFAEVMENPDLLLVHYKQFKELVTEEGLGLALKEDFSSAMEDKIKEYQEARKAQKKGFFGGFFAGSDNTSPSFITGTTLDDVMVEYQNRFIQDKVKTQIMLSDRVIDSQKNEEAIVKAFINGLLLAQTDKRVLEMFGMKPEETYSQETIFTDQSFVEKINDIQARIKELESAMEQGKKNPGSTYTKRVGEDKKINVQDELMDLRHAEHTLRTNAHSVDEADIDALKSKPAYREGLDDVMQIRGTLTERDIGKGEGLMRDTFIQYVTRSLAGKKIVPALDQQVRIQGSTTYDVEQAWESVTTNIPAFKRLEEHGIAQLVEAVEKRIVQENDLIMPIRDVVNQYLEGHTERSASKKISDTITQGINRLKELKIKVS